MPSWRCSQTYSHNAAYCVIIIEYATVSLCKANELLPPSDEIVNMRLNLLESHEVAALTFKVVEKRRQTSKMAVAAAVRAMV